MNERFLIEAVGKSAFVSEADPTKATPSALWTAHPGNAFIFITKLEAELYLVEHLAAFRAYWSAPIFRVTPVLI